MHDGEPEKLVAVQVKKKKKKNGSFKMREKSMMQPQFQFTS